MLDKNLKVTVDSKRREANCKSLTFSTNIGSSAILESYAKVKGIEYEINL